MWKRKETEYADRIKNYVGGSFIRSMFFLEVVSAMPLKVFLVNSILARVCQNSLDRPDNVKEDIKKDICLCYQKLKSMV